MRNETHLGMFATRFLMVLEIPPIDLFFEPTILFEHTKTRRPPLLDHDAVLIGSTRPTTSPIGPRPPLLVQQDPRRRADCYQPPICRNEFLAQIKRTPGGPPLPPFPENV